MIAARLGLIACATVLCGPTQSLRAQPAVAEAAKVVSVWPDGPPAWNGPTEAERDTSTAESRRVAGERVIRLGNVSQPELHLYPATGDSIAPSTVVIAPGGGYSILAWDLEGTEVARWLQSIGMSAAVLKYRVPTREEPQKWLAPVQDIQRSISMIRAGAIDGMPHDQVGVLGFSAGGNASAICLTSSKRHYASRDELDEADSRPDFGVLVYPGYLSSDEHPMKLTSPIQVDASTPPIFFAHAFDDHVSCMGSIAMFAKLKQHDIPSALHIFHRGGHGFGLRTREQVTDQWPKLCETWLKEIGAL